MSEEQKAIPSCPLCGQKLEYDGSRLYGRWGNTKDKWVCIPCKIGVDIIDKDTRRI